MRPLIAGACLGILFATAAPASALTSAQERCIGSGLPDALHNRLTDEMLSESGEVRALEEFMARATECAVSTEVDPAKRDAYVAFAVSYSIVLTSGERLEQAGYPLDALNDGITAMADANAAAPKPLFTDERITDEGIDFLADFVDKAGETFDPGDDARLNLLTLYLASAGKILSAQGLLYDDEG